MAAPMQQRKWKPPILLYVILFLMALYISLIVGYLWVDGEDTIYTFIPKMGNMFSTGIYLFNFIAAIKNFKVFGAAFLLLEMFVFLFITYDMSKQRNFMRGKEFGTSDWGVIDKLNKKFAEYEDEKKTVFTKGNRVYSDKLRIGMDGDILRINNNCLVIGGSGVGKSFNLLTPNIYQANPYSRFPGSYIFTDPKGELLQKNGKYLESVGYKVKVLNLVPGMMKESDRFNPFLYIRDESDIIKLINNLFANTTPKGATPSDPFWEKAELMFLKSLFLLVWMEHKRFGWDMTFNTVMDLLNKAEVNNNSKSELDKIFAQLVYETAGDPHGGFNHPAYVDYHKAMGGAADTVRSIIISANARLAIFDNPEIKRILSGDDLDLATIGTGKVDGKENVKTALFCVIPDADTSYNCLAGMLYTLLFQELYYQADFIYGGKLPVPVTFWLDEFANIALPDNFTKMLTTMRSRLIGCVIFIQNLAQIKALFEKDWEVIPGNCDVCVYLGGNEQSTFEYISKNLGKKTIYKRSHGESKGRNGSSSINDDALGRELMLPEEVRELDNDYCIVFVRGKKPILDHKFRTLNCPEFKKSKELGVYIHSAERARREEIKISEISAQEALARAEDLIEINLDKALMTNPNIRELEKIVLQNKEEEQAELEREKDIDITNMSLDELLMRDDFILSDDELEQVNEGVKAGLSDDDIKSYILYGDAVRMRSKRLLLETIMLRRTSTGG